MYGVVEADHQAGFVGVGLELGDDAVGWRLGGGGRRRCPDAVVLGCGADVYGAELEDLLCVQEVVVGLEGEVLGAGLDEVCA